MEASEVKRRLNEADSRLGVAMRAWREARDSHAAEVKIIQSRCAHESTRDEAATYVYAILCRDCGAAVDGVSEL